MQLSIDQKDIDKFLMIGDKVLIKPKNPQSQTKTGLYLPPSVQQGEKIQAGYIIKTGPGYPLPSQSEEHEVWEKKKGEEVQYLPLQAREGDLAVYLQNAAYEINFNDETVHQQIWLDSCNTLIQVWLLARKILMRI